MGKYQPLELLSDQDGKGVSAATVGKFQDISGSRGTIHVFLDVGATAAVVQIKFGNALDSAGGTSGFVIAEQYTLPNSAKNNTRGDGVVLDPGDDYRYASVDVVSVAGGKVRAVMNRSEG